MALKINNENLFNEVVSNAIQAAITNCATDALAKRWERAIERAVTEIQENPFLDYDETEAHLLILSSTSNNIYSANGVCQCLTFNNGHPCWHRAAARVWRLYLEAVNKPLPAVEETPAIDSIRSFNNAPYFKQTSTAKAQKIGNVRI